jgi:hypothetical protein
VTTVAARLAVFLLASLFRTPAQPRATRVEDIAPGTFYPVSAVIKHALRDMPRLLFFSRDARSLLTRTVSLAYTGSKDAPWASQVTDNPPEEGNLVLSAQPIHPQMGPFCELLHRPENPLVVVRLLEDWETKNNDLVVPVTEMEWGKRGVTVRHIEARDFYPLSTDQFDQAVQAIREARTMRGNSIVHCKAGVGRSAAAVAAYLATTKLETRMPWSPELPKTTNEVLDYLKRFRPVNLNTGQKTALDRWVAGHRPIEA